MTTAATTTTATTTAATTSVLRPDTEMSLVDLLDRLLAGGVVISGDLTISLADVDLVHISLRALVSSVHTLLEPR